MRGAGAGAGVGVGEDKGWLAVALSSLTRHSTWSPSVSQPQSVYQKVGTQVTECILSASTLCLTE